MIKIGSKKSNFVFNVFFCQNLHYSKFLFNFDNWRTKKLINYILFKCFTIQDENPTYSSKHRNSTSQHRNPFIDPNSTSKVDMKG